MLSPTCIQIDVKCSGQTRIEKSDERKLFYIFYHLTVEQHFTTYSTEERCDGINIFRKKSI
jgi:hypothetical protein